MAIYNVSFSEEMISAILLAAGEAKRMGQLKQLMPFGQSTIIEQAIDNLLGAAVYEVIVVVGYRAEEVIKTIAAKPVKITINPDYEQGMSTSIIAGLKCIDSRAQAILIALGDQPLVDTQTINRLIEEFYEHDKGIVVPAYQGRRGHPIIFAAEYKKDLLKLEGDVGGRELIEDNANDVLEIAVDSEGVIADINTLNDYQSYLS